MILNVYYNLLESAAVFLPGLAHFIVIVNHCLNCDQNVLSVQADQMGTIVEILVEDGKPISVDTICCFWPAKVLIACNDQLVS